MRQRHILFGPPGTGKTTALLREVEKAIKKGILPERIGFVSFSRRALAEAKERVAGVADPRAFVHFRTIHATAYHLLGLQRGDVLQKEHLNQFGDRAGLRFGRYTDQDQQMWEGSDGDRILGLYALAKARGTNLEHEWRAARLEGMPWVHVRRVAALYDRFKDSLALWDFGDMIEKAEGALDVDVLFVDEAQDTSMAQWNFLRRVVGHVGKVYFAGDDDQAVYAWNGAAPEQLLRFKGKRAVLPQSYRLPQDVKALGDVISSRIKVRVPKEFRPRDEVGVVQWLPEPSMADLHQQESWLLLGRSNYQLNELRTLCRQQGVVFTLPTGEWSWTLPSVQAAIAYERLRKGGTVTRPQARLLTAVSAQFRPITVRKEAYVWDDLYGEDSRDGNWMERLTEMPLRDREYVRALRRSGESLVKPGRVRVSTVHGAKGAEADHVLLLTDVSERVASSAEANPDAEHRVQYVAVTRAKKSVTLIQPKSNTYWTF